MLSKAIDYILLGGSGMKAIFIVTISNENNYTKIISLLFIRSFF